MGRDISAEAIRNQSFGPPPLGKRGYSSDEVDAYLQVIADAVVGRSRLSEDVPRVVFHTPPAGTPGYDAEQVDAFLDAIEAQLGAPDRSTYATGDAPRARGPASGEAPEAPPPDRGRATGAADAAWYPAKIGTAAASETPAPVTDDLASTWVPSPFTSRPLHLRLSLLVWVPIVVAVNAPVVAATVSSFSDPSPEPLSSAGVFGLFAVLVTFVAAWHVAPFVAADDSGATVHGLTRRIHLPWSAVDDVRLVHTSNGGGADISVITGGAMLEFQTPRKRVRALAPSGSPELGKPMEVLRTRFLLYRDQMRRPGEPAGPITRSIGTFREIVAWAYALMPAGFIIAYYLDGGK